MKKTKVIIPALGILLLSTAASVTGTVAWFSANAQVTATDMKVTAVSSNLFLQISNSDNASSNANKTSAAAVTAAADLAPADYKAIAAADGTVTWGKTVSNDPALVNYTAKEGLEDILSADLGNYVWSDSFNFWIIGSNGATGANLKLENVTVSGTTDMQEALRVLVVGEDAAMLWHPNGASENGTALSTTNLVDVVNYKTTDPAPTGFLSVVPNGAANTKAAQVYIYFDGNDDSCTSNNAQDLAQLTISLSFGVDA